MHGRIHFGLSVPVFLLWLSLISPSIAQEARGSGGDGRTLEFVDQLKDVIQRAERSRSADPGVLQELRDLVRRYDWPWRASLLYDDFRDGDYTFDPRWTTINGDFWVSQNAGLRTRFEIAAATRRASSSGPLDILEGIFRGASASRGQDVEPQSASAAHIYTEVPITNAFAVKFEIGSRGYPQEGNRIEFGPFRGAQQDGGYRLAYEPGKRPSFTLLRVAPGRSSIIEMYDEVVDLDDGQLHQIEWRRAADGTMTVLLDGKEIIQTFDRAFNHSFDGFVISNKGGDYTIRRVAIFGTQKNYVR